MYKAPPTSDHADAPLDARGVVDPIRCECRQFGSKDYCEMAGGSRGTIESMRMVFKKYTQEMETKQVVILKEVKALSTKLWEYINRVEHM